MSRTLQMLARAQTAAPTTDGGEPLAPTVQAKMEQSFRHDFSAVRIHQGRTAADLGALAFTSGNHVHFAPGRYDPHGAHGQELLGHELAHVVQQSSGRVAPTVQGKGMAINDDDALEREADEAGARAARGEPAGIPSGGTTPSAVVQGMFTHNDVEITSERLDGIVEWLSQLQTFEQHQAAFDAVRNAGDAERDLIGWIKDNLGLMVAFAAKAKLASQDANDAVVTATRDAKGKDKVPSRSEGDCDRSSQHDDERTDTDVAGPSSPPRDTGEEIVSQTEIEEDSQSTDAEGGMEMTVGGDARAARRARGRRDWRSVGAHVCKKPFYGTLATEACNVAGALSGGAIYPGDDEQTDTFFGVGIAGGLFVALGGVARFTQAMQLLRAGDRDGHRSDGEWGAEVSLGVAAVLSGLLAALAGGTGIAGEQEANLWTGDISLAIWAFIEACGSASTLRELDTSGGCSVRTTLSILYAVFKFLFGVMKFAGIILMMLGNASESPETFSWGMGFALAGAVLTAVLGLIKQVGNLIGNLAHSEDRDDASDDDVVDDDDDARLTRRRTATVVNHDDAGPSSSVAPAAVAAPASVAAAVAMVPPVTVPAEPVSPATSAPVVPARALPGDGSAGREASV